MSTRQLCVVGNEVHRAALTANAGLCECRERQEVHTFSAVMSGAAQHRLGLIAKRMDVDRLASALVLPEIGVLGSDNQFPQTYSQVSAMRLSRRWEEGLWHAS